METKAISLREGPVEEKNKERSRRSNTYQCFNGKFKYTEKFKNLYSKHPYTNVWFQQLLTHSIN